MLPNVRNQFPTVILCPTCLFKLSTCTDVVFQNPGNSSDLSRGKLVRIWRKPDSENLQHMYPLPTQQRQDDQIKDDVMGNISLIQEIRNTVCVEFQFEKFEIKHSEDLGINEDNIASSYMQNHAYSPTAYNVQFYTPDFVTVEVALFL